MKAHQPACFSSSGVTQFFHLRVACCPSAPSIPKRKGEDGPRRHLNPIPPSQLDGLAAVFGTYVSLSS
ncbi:hypothetical protein SKAU_G00195290 [Synaphobranchus kaupii]|uniref:Uncharacterized protein n=1 Tax=Synaphobranchus kaupii TaxID=118154 RepID=A0A9Q1FEQ9_SYNKA|nr:hypothetical protein SKAU_G00195290 [Synaphobranchus kaupii]